MGSNFSQSLKTKQNKKNVLLTKEAKTQKKPQQQKPQISDQVIISSTLVPSCCHHGLESVY